MELNYFDIVAAVIILLLGLKGIMNGFFKEVFGLIGIVGGLFVASRLGDNVGVFLNDLVFNFSSPSAISFTGFLATLVVFWILMLLIGYAFKTLTSLSGLGPVDRLLGFVFGASKFFFIAAVIAHAAYNIKAVRSTLDSTLANSILFPIMVETGGFIMKMDPVGISDDINETITEGTDALKTKTQELIDESAAEKIEEIKQKMEQK